VAHFEPFYPAYEEIHYTIGEPTKLEVLKLRMTEFLQKALLGFKR
jgi:hypothetical protein